MAAPLSVKPGPAAKVYRGPKPAPEPDRLEEYLHFWARMMRGEDFGTWYPTHSTGMVSGGASESFDDMCDRSECGIAKVVGVVIAGLPAVQSCALHATYLHAVYRFRRVSALSRALELAKDNVRAGLKARHLL